MYTHMASFHFLLGLGFLSLIKYCPPLPQLGDESCIVIVSLVCADLMKVKVLTPCLWKFIGMYLGELSMWRF